MQGKSNLEAGTFPVGGNDSADLEFSGLKYRQPTIIGTPAMCVRPGYGTKTRASHEKREQERNSEPTGMLGLFRKAGR